MDEGNRTVGEYSVNSGTQIGTDPLISLSGVNTPYGIAVSGSSLFVSYSAGEVDEYTLGSTPGTIASSHPSLITGLNDISGLAVSESDLFIASFGLNGTGTIGEYTTSGGTINASLVTGLSQPYSVAVSGSNLFASNSQTGTIDEFTLGSVPGTIASSDRSIISGLSDPLGIALSGSKLFVANEGTKTIGEYTLGNNLDTVSSSTPSLITSPQDGLFSIAVESAVIPEPSTWAMLLGGLGLLAFWHRRASRA